MKSVIFYPALEASPFSASMEYNLINVAAVYFDDKQKHCSENGQRRPHLISEKDVDDVDCFR
jgi:hypothetical protein